MSHITNYRLNGLANGVAIKGTGSLSGSPAPNTAVIMTILSRYYAPEARARLTGP